MNFIKFLGTAGARFVVIKQLRASGGIFFSLSGTNLLVDPGPGCLVKSIKSRPSIDPLKIDGIFLSHKHIDHSGDINIMIEAITNGGFQKKGTLFVPQDALEEKSSVVFIYLRDFLEKVEILQEKKKYLLKNITLEIPVRHIHRVETYGFKIKFDNTFISYIPDTKYFENLIDSYKGSNIVIINTVLYEKKEELDHLSLPEAEEIIKNINPQKAILTHFGMTMLKNKIWEKTKEISERTGVEIISAKDGMTLNF